MTYAILADEAGVSRSTIESMATRPGYNASLRTIARICGVLRCSPGELLDISDEGRSRAAKGLRK
jgi:DNA-binding Xre family transcriptional regulator